jgi:hypothetical protein
MLLAGVSLLAGAVTLACSVVLIAFGFKRLVPQRRALITPDKHFGHRFAGLADQGLRGRRGV